MNRTSKCMLAAAVLAVAADGLAQDQMQPTIHANKGQSTAQQSRDSDRCMAMARKRSGVDPTVLAANSAPLQEGKGLTITPIDQPTMALTETNVGRPGAAGQTGQEAQMGSSGAGATGSSSAQMGSSGAGATGSSNAQMGSSGAGTTGSSGQMSTSEAGAMGSSGTSGTAAAGTPPMGDQAAGANATGVNGTAGTSGAMGSTGSSGAMGSSGSSGAMGAPGSSGTMASSGTTGATGTAGTGGAAGTSGMTGSTASGEPMHAKGSKGSGHAAGSGRHGKQLAMVTADDYNAAYSKCMTSRGYTVEGGASSGGN